MGEFDEYIRQGEPGRSEKAAVWQTAIGLQDVDGLKPSQYLVDTARRHIEGDITIDEVRSLIDSYYKSKSVRDEADGERTEEADKVSANIARILRSNTFSFSTNGYVSLHRRIFDGVFEHAGEIREYDITKREWVLDGDSVSYLNWEDIRRAVDYDIAQEKAFSYKGLDEEAVVNHLAKFISGLWQIHAFCEGNTRTTAVFTIQYLRSMGFDVDNQLFASHSWYFRNALVRANYRNIQKGIDYSPVYLARFLQNLLYGDSWDLKNRYLHIAPTVEWRDQPRLLKDSSGGAKLDGGGVNGGVKPEDSLMQIIAEHPGLNAPMLSKMLQRSLRTTQRQLKSLSDRHKIEFRGAPKNGGYWAV